METTFVLAEYLNQGAEQLIKDVIKSTLQSPKETAFFYQYQKSQKTMQQRRAAHEAEGLPVPMFLIASITTACNLYCKGCYARANGQCGKPSDTPMLSAAEWGDIFQQAGDAGIPFILLAGGEPMTRPEILTQAAAHKNILFPIFTNGTLVDGEQLRLMDQHRNLVPIVSMEGSQAETDGRRGAGTYQKVQTALDHLAKQKLLFGVSLTVTTQNMAEVTDERFISMLYRKGCRLVFLIEYVPVSPGTETLAPGDDERRYIEQRQQALRAQFPGMIFLSFPGDEKYMGGCLAAGRGFFHINAYGAAEPCPFSPYSDRNLRDCTLLQALASPFFAQVRGINAAETEHTGGCTLFEKDAQVRSLLCGCGEPAK